MTDPFSIKCGDYMAVIDLTDAAKDLTLTKWKKLIRLVYLGDFDAPGQFQRLVDRMEDLEAEAKQARRVASEQYADGFVSPKRFYRVPADVKRRNTKLSREVKASKAFYDRVAKIRELLKKEF